MCLIGPDATVVSFSESAIVVPSFSIGWTSGWGKPMRESSLQGWPPKPVAFGSSLGSSLVCVLSYPVGGGTTLQCDT